ncbi:MAG: sugar isomerase [Planctomycetaceae bacterium]|jgi:glucosamine--fructose-6-phosphate aminotransferase (isomerizing)|nr:sugar isomerase [Planctomycetaceae bacterium]
MNLTDPRYGSFALVREMLETPQLFTDFSYERSRDFVHFLRKTRRIFLSGEGSARIFPAKSFLYTLRKAGSASGSDSLEAVSEGCRQAIEYNLDGWTVFVASNSGQTAEAVDLMSKLHREKLPYRYAVTANPHAKLLEFATDSFVLSCGQEQAVAATKSVAEQGLVYLSLLCHFFDVPYQKAAEQTAKFSREILSAEYGEPLIQPLMQAGTIYFAGRNNGVAEELALKTNEITRQKSGYLEGTFLLHGIEEIMQPKDVLVLIDPFEAEWKRIKQRYVDALGMTVLAIAPVQTIFPTIVIPSLENQPPVLEGYNLFLQLLTGWNLLVQIGTACQINIDKPLRARKIGNAYQDAAAP